MYYDKNTIIFLDGNWVKATEAKTDLYNQTMHYGAGVFEGIRAYKTPSGFKIFKSIEHYERLIESAKAMHINLEYSAKEMDEITHTLLEKNNMTNCYIRPLVYLGANMSLTPTSTVHFMIASWVWGKFLGNDLLDVMVSSYQRPNPKSCPVHAKVVGHYTNSILATTEAKSKGFHEALLLDSDGYVAEAPGANFFLEKDEVLYTPPLGNILPGITRETIIEYAQELGVEVVEELFTIDKILGADSAFFVGTAVEVAGIKSIEGVSFQKKWEDTIGHNLAAMYRQRVTSDEHENLTIV